MFHLVVFENQNHKGLLLLRFPGNQVLWPAYNRG
jgi:hypothetical protein